MKILFSFAKRFWMLFKIKIIIKDMKYFGLKQLINFIIAFLYNYQCKFQNC
jgi:hypothetical protein